MRFSAITYVDVNCGNGCRVSLWVQGCTHHCKGCHNPETWCFDGGKIFDDEAKEKLFNILSLSYIDGLTLSGGDPLDSYDDVLELVIECKSKFPEKNIWLYTGYCMEDINPEILPYIDYIVDGEYKEEMRDTSLAFRGSQNQRIWKKGQNDNFQIVDL